jgi:hypothetical protein
MTDEIELTTTSYIVLGLLSFSGPATPYDLKQMVAATVGHFWSLPHSQLYSEPTRLARALGGARYGRPVPAYPTRHSRPTTAPLRPHGARTRRGPANRAPDPAPPARR